MEYKKLFILSVILCLLSMSIVSASWYGMTSFRDGDCELFRISCPSGYKNAGEIEHKDEIYISTSPTKSPRHCIVIKDIDESEINSLYDKYDIVDTVDEGDFKAYKIDTAHYKKETIAIYYKDGYNYILKIDHQGCEYDDNQFRSDVDLLRRIANSIYRK